MQMKHGQQYSKLLIFTTTFFPNGAAHWLKQSNLIGRFTISEADERNRKKLSKAYRSLRRVSPTAATNIAFSFALDDRDYNVFGLNFKHIAIFAQFCETETKVA